MQVSSLGQLAPAWGSRKFTPHPIVQKEKGKSARFRSGEKQLYKLIEDR
jgi:hypothetical protein